MSSFQSIWSGVKRWTSSLFSRSQNESESDLRERLDQRVEAQMRKAEGVERLRKELHGARSDMKTLSGQVTKLRSKSDRSLSSVSGRLDDLKELVRRLGKTLAVKEQELEQIEAAAANMSWRREVRTQLVAVLVGFLPLLVTLSLWRAGQIPSILTKEQRMSQKEIETLEAGQELQRARQNLSRADSVRLERLIQESR
jgi:hypothetical protein